MLLPKSFLAALAVLAVVSAVAADTTLRTSMSLEPAGPLGAVLDVADLDGDGRPEVVASFGFEPGDSVLVLRHGAPGSRPQRFAFPSVADHEEISDTGDVNGDGRADLVAWGLDSVVVHYGAPGPSLISRGVVGVAPGDFVTAALGDLVGDEADDVILLSETRHRVEILESHVGGLPAGSGVSLATVHGPVAAWVRDLNGDGRADLVVLGTSPAQLGYHRALAGGGFAAPDSFETEPVVDVLDVDGDELDDLLLPSGVQPGLGDGAFGSLVPSDHTVHGAADLDEDGRLDLYGVAQPNAPAQELRVQLAQPGGTFAPSRPGPAAPSSLQARFVAADVDGDTHAEIVALSADQRAVAVFRGRGDGRFAAPPRDATSFEPHEVRLADVDGDARRDLLVATAGANALEWRPGLGDGTFGASVSLAAPAGTRFLQVADLEGDGDLDALTAVASPASFTVWRNVPGVFAPRVDVPVGGAITWIGLIETTGDARPDVLLGTSAGVVRWPNDGAGGFSSGALFGVGASAAVAGADVDHDGDLDLVGFDASGLSLYPRTGASTFGAPVGTPFAATALALCVADLDGDGWTDAAVVCSTPDGLAIFAGQPGGSFAAPAFLPRRVLSGGGTCATLRAADVTGDGVLDLVTARAGMGVALVWVGRGDRTFEPELSLGAVRAGTLAGCDLGDLNADGHADVVVSSGRAGASGEVGVLMGGASVTGASPPAVPSALRLSLARNPVGDRVRGALHGARGEAVVALLDVAGRRVRQARLAPAANGAPRAFDLGERDGLAPGVYVLLARADGVRTSARVTVLR